jgi:hypothetical protein
VKQYWTRDGLKSFNRKIKIAKLFGMDINGITHTHWNYSGSSYIKKFKIPIESNKDFIKHYLGTWV